MNLLKVLLNKLESKMSNNKHYFHFTLGPVQSFVGQARRTRDFWAGSFLLSWLSGVAMQSAISQGGEVLFPKADQNFLNAILGKSPQQPKQGSIPNRFKVAVGDDFSPQNVIEDVQNAWQSLANEIYEKEIAPYALENTAEIWGRQIKQFWEISWVLVDELEDSSGLDRRKNWRSQYLPDEAGIKCTLMGDWQELSGVEGVRKKDREARETFWRNFTESYKSDFSDESEMLCAMSYVKRRFLNYFANFKVKLTAFTAHGWGLPKSVPSVAYIAGANWYANVLEKAEATQLETFFEASKQLFGLPEYDSTINCVEQTHHNKQFKGIDGNSFHEIALDNHNVTPNQTKAGEVKKFLKPLIKQFGAVSPFYAVLMMDGDQLGKQMSDLSKQDKITQGLAEFTEKVPEIVKGKNGFLIYAGGDDVLALVTLENALQCALAIRTHYQQCFENTDIKTSISAAVIYTHINSPLKNILHESHELLDDIAKERAGRDAIAIRVYKGSGLFSQWARKWDEAVNNGQFIIEDLMEKFKEKSKDEPQFSNGFFYKIRERFELIYGKGNEETTLSDENVLDLMAMEYIQSLESKITIEKAKEVIAPLMEQARNSAVSTQRMTADAGLLIRFLAQKGIEGGR